MKNFAAYVRKMLSQKAFLNVFAEEPTPTTTEPNAEPKVEDPEPTKTPEPTPEPVKVQTENFDSQIAKAREEEKAKLYPQIEKLKKDKSDLLDAASEHQKTITKLEKDLAKQKTLNEKLSADLEEGNSSNKTVQELTLTISQLERQLEETTVAHEQELSKIQLDAIKKERIAEAKGAILPELVTGNTVEEIEESVEKAKARYAEIVASVASTQSNRMPMSNPSFQNTQLTSEASIEDISKMSPAEYAVYRAKIGIK